MNFKFCPRLPRTTTGAIRLMANKAGTADLPLHGGRVPKWLADRMTNLGALIGEAIVHHYGRDELLRRLAHPFWFQSFGAVMGMDWHSSGITTSVIGALKRGLAPLATELGVHVCGGRGKHSRQTPHELVAIGERVGFDGAALARASRLVAKVDSAAVQDGFDLYLHGFIVTDDGHWVVVQQGMNGERRQARRYHWLSEGLKSFVEQPHTAIDGPEQGEIINLTDRRAAASRQTQIDILQSLGPDRIARHWREAQSCNPQTGQAAAVTRANSAASGHAGASRRSPERRIRAPLAWHAGRSGSSRPGGFPGAAAGSGCRATDRAVAGDGRRGGAGAPCRFTDPARFSFAHGGKDRHPFPVPLRVYDETIKVLKSAIRHAKLGQEERLGALKRLDDQARRLERLAAGPSVPALIALERQRSASYGGRSVFGWERNQAPAKIGNIEGR